MPDPRRPPGALVLEFVRRDALAAIIPALAIPARVDLRALPVGRREDGQSGWSGVHGTHVLIAGCHRGGEGLAAVVDHPGHAPAMVAGLVRVWAADPKLMELAYGRAIFDRYGRYAASPEAILAMLEDAVAQMQARAAAFAGKHREHTPTAEHPFTVIVVDEVAFLTAYLSDRAAPRPDQGRAGHADHPGPRGRLLRRGGVAGPAQGGHVHPEPVPRPDRDAPG